MWKYTVEVNGMMCGMGEAHGNDAVRKACPVKKVNSSRSKNQTVILSETELDTEAVMNAIRGTGYEVGAIQKEPYKKRGLFSTPTGECGYLPQSGHRYPEYAYLINVLRSSLRSSSKKLE